MKSKLGYLMEIEKTNTDKYQYLYLLEKILNLLLQRELLK